MLPEQDVREWMRKADQDRRLAQAALEQSPPITDGAAFHCQQAVEKLLKAYLVFRSHPFEKIHDLRALTIECVRFDPGFTSLQAEIVPLTAYAVRFRYPGPVDPTVEQVRDALEVVQRVQRWVERLTTRPVPPVPQDQAPDGTGANDSAH